MVAFNNWKLTARSLASIFKSSYPKENYEIIFIDNASTDNTESLINYLVKLGEPIKYMKMNEDLDYLRGANVGVKEVQSPFFLLMNNDVFLQESCIENLMKSIKSDEKIGIAGAMEFLLNGTRTTRYTYLDREALKLGKYATILKDDKDVEYDALGLVDVEITGGACNIFRKSVTDKIGFYDELFCPCMHEHEDYCLRIKLGGYRVVKNPNAKMFHVVGATTAFNPNYYYQVCLRNTEKFVKKWRNLI